MKGNERIPSMERMQVEILCFTIILSAHVFEENILLHSWF
jgi:hypothetical protein